MHSGIIQNSARFHPVVLSGQGMLSQTSHSFDLHDFQTHIKRDSTKIIFIRKRSHIYRNFLSTKIVHIIFMIQNCKIWFVMWI